MDSYKNYVGLMLVNLLSYNQETMGEGPSKLIKERNTAMITKNMFEESKVFEGKVVVITGGSRGIGFAAVKVLL